jgi:hypothetical protein
MKANELRIGNYYEYFIVDKLDSRKEWWQLSKIDTTDLSYLVNNDDDEDFRPIPLTEEWLFKLGFELNGCNFELPNFRFHITKPANYDGFLFCDGCSVITEKIQYVHQLQNLYFTLTNEEIKL